MLVQPITVLTAIIAKSIYDQLTGKKEGGLLSPTSLLGIDEDTSSPLTEKNAQQLSMVDDMTFQKLKEEVLAELPEVITKVLYIMLHRDPRQPLSQPDNLRPGVSERKSPGRPLPCKVPLT